jgi:hypothetical protein
VPVQIGAAAPTGVVEQGNCTLSTAPPTPGSANYASAFANLELGGGTNYQSQIVVIGTGVFAVTSTISVSCGGDHWFATNPGIIAIKVGNIQ